MKTFKLFESIILGSLIGVVVSAYLLFMDTIGRDFGTILRLISLTDVLQYFPVDYRNSIIFNFLFYIAVYTVYVVLLNFLFRMHKKLGIALSIILMILVASSVFQQIDSFKKPLASENLVVESGSLSNFQTIKKYFGEEIKGDLNNDTIADIAFLIKRNEGDEREDMYYLSASLKINDGYEGLNLLYIGEKVIIEKLEIENGIITVSYKEGAESEEILQYKAKVVEDRLVQVEETEEVKEE
jgi:hypothetical protein